MGRRARIRYTDAMKSTMWDMYQQRESLWSIARYFDRYSSSIYPILAKTGGIRPPERNRRSISLNLAEREEISRGLVAGRSSRAIAKLLGRSPSTISRAVPQYESDLLQLKTGRYRVIGKEI
jgi:hypothetical protein